MTLANVLKAQNAPQVVKQTTRLRDAIVEQWTRDDKNEPPTIDTWTRASSIGSKFCPRLLAISALRGLPYGEKFDAETLWKFGIGTSYHELFQREILRELFAERGAVFHGWWKRVEIPDKMVRFSGTMLNGIESRSLHAVSHEVRGPRNKSVGGNEVTLGWGWTPKPEGKGWEYVELIFRSEKYLLTGHCDGVLVWPDFVELFELKSINERGFDSVNPLNGGRPKPEHVAQVNAYMWLAGLGRCRLVYVLKGDKRLKDSFAEHIVLRDDRVVGEIQDGLTLARASVNGICTGLKNGQKPSELLSLVPGRLSICKNRNDYRVKNCNMKSPCFAKDLLAWKPRKSAP